MSFVIMNRALVYFKDLIFWTKQVLPDIKYYTKMNVIELDSRDFRYNLMRITSIEGHVARFNVSVLITVISEFHVHRESLAFST